MNARLLSVAFALISSAALFAVACHFDDVTVKLKWLKCELVLFDY